MCLLFIILHIGVTPQDTTFMLTGVHDHHHGQRTKKVKANHSMNAMQDHETPNGHHNPRNQSVYEYSPFGISIDHIDKK